MQINAKYKIELLNGQNVIVDSDNNVCGVADFNDIKIFLWQL